VPRARISAFGTKVFGPRHVLVCNPIDKKYTKCFRTLLFSVVLFFRTISPAIVPAVTNSNPLLYVCTKQQHPSTGNNEQRDLAEKSSETGCGAANFIRRLLGMNYGGSLFAVTAIMIMIKLPAHSMVGN